MTPDAGDWNVELIVIAAVALIGLIAVLLFVALVVIDTMAAPLKKCVNWWNSVTAGPADPAGAVLEEPSVVAFFDALRAGPVAPPACAAAAANPLWEFYDSAPGQLAELQKLFSEIGRASDEATRRESLLESIDQASKLRKRAGLPELLPVWQVAFALEELLKQLLRKASNVTPSVLRTTAGALDLLRELCNRRSR